MGGNRLFLVMALVACTACVTNLDVPSDAEVQCIEDRDCPTGYTCRATVGRCISTTSGDDQPPGVASSSVSPGLASQGVTITIEVTADEPLTRADDATPMTVVLNLPSRPRAVMTGVDGDTYTFVYTPTGDEDEGVVSVMATLTDAAGNQATDISVGVVTFDFQAPDVWDFTVVGTPLLAAGDTGRIRFTTDSDLSSQGPVVALLDGTTLTPEDAVAPPVYEFSITPDGTEAEGAVPVTVRVADEAGNVADPMLFDAFVFDFTDPDITSSSAVPRVASLGDEIVITLAVSEVLAAIPTLSVTSGAASLDFSHQAGTEYTYSHQLDGSELDGTYSSNIDLTDLAGNTSIGIVGPTVTVDVTPPSVSSFQVQPDRVGLGDVLRVTFDTDSDVADSGVRVAVAGIAMPCGPRQSTGPHYTCARTIDGSEGGATTAFTAAVVVDVRDNAGNIGSADAGVMIDFEPPYPVTVTGSYEPGIDNPLPAVTAVREGTRIEVYVEASEALDPGSTPVLTAGGPGGATLTFTLDQITGSRAVFSTTVGAGYVDGSYVIDLDGLTDIVGNVASTYQGLGGISVKTSVPTLAIDQAAVSFVRSPWGNAAAESLGSFTIPAGTYFALAPADPRADVSSLPATTFERGDGSAPTVIRLWRSDAVSELLATVQPRSDGTWPRQQLPPTDTVGLWATAVDEAGNESPPQLIHRTIWIVTPNQPAFGISPHRLETTTYLEGTLAQNPDTTTAFPVGAEGLDAEVVAVRSQARWRYRDVLPDNFSQRKGLAVAYDSARDQLVMFGGNDTYARNDVWELSGGNWRNVLPSSAAVPSGRENHAMVYDSARGRVLMFGGRVNGAPVDDLWEWDGQRWLEITKTTPWPDARYEHAMAYDSTRGELVLFGGADGGGPMQDMWRWDGVAWSPQTISGEWPTARQQHAMAYDSDQDFLVLFGGEISAAPVDDTWVYASGAWFDVTPATRPLGYPTAVRGHTMAYDPQKSQVVLLGGNTGGTSVADAHFGSWSPNGGGPPVGGWTASLVTSNQNAPARAYHAMAYHAGLGGVVAVAGMGPVGAGNWQDTWALLTNPAGNELWQELTPGPRPEPRQRHTMTYDHARGEIVLFGGQGLLAPLDDTWVWAGRRWEEASVGSAPEARHSHAAGYDAARELLFLFGGLTAASGVADDWWEWDGTSWNDVGVITGPDARFGHTIGSDDVRQRLVLFGGRNSLGQVLGDTWEWNGAVWMNVSPVFGEFPEGRFDHVTASDGTYTYIFGGNNASFQPFGDLWSWNGAAWVETLLAGPSARARAALAFDRGQGGRILMWGGQAVTGLQADMWELNSAAGSWLEKTPSGRRPTGRSGHAMAFDALRGRVVLFGGFDGILRDDTWEWDTAATRRPAVQLTVDVSNAAVLPTAVTGLHLRGRCGGLGTTTGAELVAWRTGGVGVGPGVWSVLDSNPQSTNLTDPQTGWLSWSAADVAEARQLFVERSQVMALQCRPIGGAGASGGESDVAVDFVEVRIEYDASLL